MKKLLYLLLLAAISISLIGAEGRCQRRSAMTSEQVMDRMTAAMIDSAKTFHLQGLVDVSTNTPLFGSAAGGGALNFSFNLDGYVDQTEKSAKAKSDVSGQLETQGVTISGKGKTMLADDYMYLLIEQAPAFFMPNVERNVWTKKPFAQTELTPEEMYQLKQLLKNHRLFKVAQDFGVEKSKASTAYHYKLAFDRAEAVKYMEDWAKVKKMEVTRDMRDELEPLLDQAEKIDAEIWIDQSSFYISRLKVNMPIEEDDQQLDFSADLTLDQYNEPVEISIPADAKEVSPEY
ncbi:MAG: DUF6612 family protein [Patescibacteria group bacterium]